MRFSAKGTPSCMTEGYNCQQGSLVVVGLARPLLMSEVHEELDENASPLNSYWLSAFAGARSFTGESSIGHAAQCVGWSA